MIPRDAQSDHAPQRFGWLELGIAVGIIVLVLATWHVREARRFAVHVRKAQYHEMRTFMSCLESAVMDRKARVGVVRFADVDGVVTEWLEKGVDEYELEPKWVAMWKAKRDVWGGELRFERTQLRPDTEKVVIRSAGLDGTYGGPSPDDIVATLYLTTDARNGHFPAL